MAYTEDNPFQCLSCGHRFAWDDLGRMITTPDGRTYIQCPACSARNEIDTAPTPGAGEPPHARVTGLLDER